ncbi:MAG: transcriptional regulator [Salinigranum sp.]
MEETGQSPIVGGDLDAAFTALAEELRRRLLVSLLDRDRCRLASFVEDVGASDSDAEDLRTVMYHVHLPKLEQHGYVRWDRDRGRIERGPAFGEVRPLLKWVRDSRRE